MTFKQLLAFASALLFSTFSVGEEVPVQPASVVEVAASAPTVSTHDRLVKTVMKYHNISEATASEIVAYAQKYERETFPTAKDILAVIGIESKFNPKAVNGPASNPSVGLMQTCPNSWKRIFHPSELKTIEGQVKRGSEILATYYKTLGSRDAAIKSYNIGIGAYQRGMAKLSAQQYIGRFHKEYARYKHVE